MTLLRNSKFNLKSTVATVTAVLIIVLLFFPIKTYVSNKKLVKFEITKLNDITVDKNLLLAIAKTESGYSQNKTSPKQAIGVFQIKQETFDYVVDIYSLKNRDIFNVKDNVKIGCLYFQYLYNKFSDEDIAIIAYNAGEGNVRKWLDDKRYSADGVTIDNIPFKETKNYLKRVKFYYKLMKKVEKW